MKEEKSCGAVVFRKNNTKIEFLIIQNKIGKHWDFAKGHCEKGETEEETAQREVLEETGLNITLIPNFKESIDYLSSSKTHKTVVYFLGLAKDNKVKIQKEEISGFSWLSLESAIKKLNFETARTIISKANSFLTENLITNKKIKK